MHKHTEMVCRPYITLRNGKRIYAANYGLRAFCFMPKCTQDEYKQTKKEKASQSEARNNRR